MRDQAQHTPGPWAFDGREINAHTNRVVDDQEGIWSEADGRLIAAAPDLLKALQGAVAELGSIANYLHTLTGPIPSGEARAIAAEMVRIGGPIRAAIVKAVAFDCPLCGQRINDGKPCGCGAR